MNDDIFTFSSDCFNIGQILECGQCFRFDKISDNEYYITAFGKKLLIKQYSKEIMLSPTTNDEFEKLWKHYFDLETDYSKIQEILTANDFVMRDAVEFAPGIRLLNQDTWECLISFIISQNNNISRIKKIIENLCCRFGDESSDGSFSFPSPKILSEAKIKELVQCGTGYRAEYISRAAKKIHNGEIDLEDFKSLSTKELGDSLMKIKGIGRKVADCITLFSFARKDIFPVDVWSKRVMEHFYFNGNEVSINEIHQKAQKLFGCYGGYAQQYLYHYARNFL